MKIAILSRSSSIYSTRRLYEACLARGHSPIVIDHLKCNLLIEKGVPAIHYQGQSLQDVDAIIPRIGASVTFYGSAVIRQFEMMRIFTSISSHALLCSRDKLHSLQLLSAAGLGLPRTVFTNYSKNVDDILDSVGAMPVIIKLLEGTQGLGVVLAENRKAARSVVEAFNGLKARVIVQEFVKEARGTDIRAFVVNHKVVGAIQRTAPEGEFRSNIHRGGKAVQVELTQEQEQAAIHAARVMGLGVAGVDMLPSGRGPLILEVNSSPGLEGIEKSTGQDIAGEVVAYLEQARPLPE